MLLKMRVCHAEAKHRNVTKPQQKGADGISPAPPKSSCCADLQRQAQREAKSLVLK